MESLSSPTRVAARPKKVLAPVEMTIPSASPILQVDPLRRRKRRRERDEGREVSHAFQPPFESSSCSSRRVGKAIDSREGLVSELLVDGKRLSSKGGLIHRNLDSLGKSAIGRADISVLERNL